MIIIGSVVQSTHPPLLIWRVKTHRNYFPCGRSFTLGRRQGHRDKDGGGRRRRRWREQRLKTQPADSLLSTIASLSKHLQTNGFVGLTSSNVSLQTTQRHHLLFVYEWSTLFLLFSLYLTQRELMELLWGWCMGDCARRQMGKCNYGCFRASGRGKKKKTCHKREFKKQRQRHSSCETIVRKN